MSIRPHKMERKRQIAQHSWRFYIDKQGRLRRRCRCAYCSPGYRRPAPGARLDRAETS